MSDENKNKVGEVAEQLGLASENDDIKLVVDSGETENQKYLVKKAKQTMTQIDEMLESLKAHIDAVEVYSKTSESDKSKTLCELIDTYVKLVTVKQKYGSHLLEIFKKSVANKSPEGEPQKAKGYTSTEIKRMLEEQKRGEEVF